MAKKQEAPTPKATGAARHARLGPSGYKSREICPSYKNDQKDTVANLEGDMLHGMMEKHDVRVLKSQEFKLLDDERQISMIEMVHAYIVPIFKAADLVEKEVELDLSFLKLPDTDLGTADIIALQTAARHLDVVDYKFGWLEVDDAETNIQGWIYALGAFNRHQVARTCTVRFLQPRRDELSEHTFTRDQIPEMILRTMTIYKRVEQRAGKDFNPVIENCLWCANKAACKALHGMVLKLEGYTPLEFPETVKQWDPTKLNDPDEAAALYEFVAMLIKWGYDVKDRIVTLAVEGYEIPGFELKGKRGKTSIIDAARAIEIARDQFGVKFDTIDDFLAVAEPSLSGLEKAIGALQPRGEKGTTKTKFREELAKEGILENARPSQWLESTKA